MQVDLDGDGKVTNKDIVKTPLKQNGDFRSAESIELLKECDVVVTNPPFSLFREYIAQLIEYKKKFLVIGNQNAITYKEIFPLIRDNKIWLGTRDMGAFEFKLPSNATLYKRIDSEGNKYATLGSVCWFTNIPHNKRNEKLILTAEYDPKKYPKYDNYDAIEVGKVVNILKDYKGVMGVPITFLYKYCPEQFEIVAFRKGDDGKDLVFTRERENSTILSYPSSTAIAGMIKNKEGKINGKITYARILIMHKK